MNESQIFTNALKLATPAERAAYLDEACTGDPQMRAAVAASYEHITGRTRHGLGLVPARAHNEARNVT